MSRSSLIFLGAIAGIFIGCDDTSPPDEPVDMLVAPEVRVSENNYDEEDIFLNFTQTPIQQEFYEAYRNCTGIYTDRLVDFIIEDMQKQAFELAQDPVALTKCIYAANWAKRDDLPFIALPCLAEKAQYDTHDVWIIIFVWGYDIQGLSHYATFVMDIASYERLYYTRCR